MAETVESTVKLIKITFEYSNGSKVVVNAEDLDTLSRAFMVLIENLKQMGDAHKKS